MKDSNSKDEDSEMTAEKIEQWSKLINLDYNGLISLFLFTIKS